MNAPTAAHPSAETLAAFGLGQLDSRTAETVAAHLAGCAVCRHKADTHSTDGGSAKTSGPAAAKGAPMPTLVHPDYEVLRELGRGGMGVVYLARNRLMDRLEVLKVVNRALLDKPGVEERFLREIQSAARLKHHNIVTAYSVLRLSDSLAFAMEYVEGEDLAETVRARGPLPVPHAVHCIQQAALGLQHAHEKGMVHRDIKPSNLIVTRDGKKLVAKILDFGLAKATSEQGTEKELTGAGKMLGTPDFVAPEQTLDAAKAGIRADIYSLGCTLYFLLSGGPPFQANSLYELLHAHQMATATPLNAVRPEVPAELAAVVAKMMAKKPDEHFQTPAEVATALAPFARTPAKAAVGQAVPDTFSEKRPAQPDLPSRTRTPPTAVPRVTPPVASKEVWVTLTEETPKTSAATGASGPKGTPEPATQRRSPWLWPAVAGGAFLAVVVSALAIGAFVSRKGDSLASKNSPEKELGRTTSTTATEPTAPPKPIATSAEGKAREPEIKKSPTAPSPAELLARANAHASKSEWPQAEADYSTVLKLQPDNVDARRRRAAVSVALKRYANAVADYEKLLQLDPENAPVQNELAWLLATCPDATLRNSERALTLAGKAVARDPNNGHFHNTLGMAHYRAGNWKDAIDALEKAMELRAGGDGLDWFILAMAHSHLGNQAKARRWFDRAVGWMDANKPTDEELGRFRAEATTLLASTPTPPAKERTLPLAARVVPPRDGFDRLFDGKEMLRWKRHTSQPGNWDVTGGFLIGTGSAAAPVSHLYSRRGEYKDFILRVEARVNGGGDSGIYVRAPFGPQYPPSNPQWPRGYNIKLDAKNLGGLLVDTGPGVPVQRVQVPQAVAGNNWLTLEVFAVGSRIIVVVNDQVTADSTDGGWQFDTGHIVLQQHTANTRVEFRKIEIKELAQAPGNRLPPGSVWKGARTYRWGAGEGRTVNYELHVDKSDGKTFQGFVLESGGNRREVEGSILGDFVSWRETTPGQDGDEIRMRATVRSGTIWAEFAGHHPNGQVFVEGDGELKRTAK